VVAGFCAIKNMMSWDSIGAPIRHDNKRSSKTRNRHLPETTSKVLENQGLRTITARLWDGCESILTF
jgi:hypothetical protein